MASSPSGAELHVHHCSLTLCHCSVYSSVAAVNSASTISMTQMHSIRGSSSLPPCTLFYRVNYRPWSLGPKTSSIPCDAMLQRCQGVQPLSPKLGNRRSTNPAAHVPRPLQA
ncbi:hypothetical protein SERLADRAFT_457019 [Serpula lacrymans var. lacrymans S7.9]|uniref:Uncharacterized protein n=1 Tax=Serpula lacrymans var. lacrymans (strain S7.9) TaxID=578457 RepID=F8NGJ0_SERL9|nr:uncharacterized protein SERLADRAFT_457019 [Serpula lacrymans var. lacrymans S7.9]EGO29377.1 hypothetical protein SERLADRAFT_457019 [Serpula lacrymans var. lacrymans S7.9]